MQSIPNVNTTIKPPQEPSFKFRLGTRRYDLWRTIRYAFEAIGLYSAFCLFALLPLDMASRFGGFLGRSLGRFMGKTRVADENLRHVLPHLTELERTVIIGDMWENLGRSLGELPHLKTIWKTRLNAPDIGILQDMKSSPSSSILFAAHLGNWELMPFVCKQLGMNIKMIYREPNNCFMDPLIHSFRGCEQGLAIPDLIPKGRSGAKWILQHLKAGGQLGMLVDQKMNDGVLLPFMGKPAMTAMGLAQLATKFSCPVLGGRVKRLRDDKGRYLCKFEGFLTAITPPPMDKNADTNVFEAAYMEQVNGILEGWIRDDPSQWLWIHRRWGRWKS